MKEWLLWITLTLISVFLVSFAIVTFSKDSPNVAIYKQRCIESGGRLYAPKFHRPICFDKSAIKTIVVKGYDELE